MTERKGNKNSQRSRKLIKNAFFDLLMRKDLEKITVTDVINGAEISRATFYAHYSDIEDLFAAIQDEAVDLIEAHLKNYGVEAIFKNPAAYFHNISGYVGENIERFKMMAGSKNAVVLFKQFFERLKKRLVSIIEEHSGELSDSARVRFRIWYNAISSSVFEWLCGDMDTSFNSMTDIIASMLDEHSNVYQLN